MVNPEAEMGLGGWTSLGFAVVPYGSSPSVPYRSRYVPTAVGYHMGGATTQGDKNPRYYELQHRNALAVMIKNVPARFLLRHLPVIVWHQLIGLVYSLRAGMLSSHLRALGAAFHAAPGWLRDRRIIMRGRRIDPQEFDRFVTARRS